jgi:hypothetical protein
MRNLAQRNAHVARRKGLSFYTGIRANNVTDCELEGTCFSAVWWDETFPSCQHNNYDIYSTCFSIGLVPLFLIRILPGVETDHSAPSNAEVKKNGSIHPLLHTPP